MLVYHQLLISSFKKKLSLIFTPNLSLTICCIDKPQHQGFDEDYELDVAQDDDDESWVRLVNVTSRTQTKIQSYKRPFIVL